MSDVQYMRNGKSPANPLKPHNRTSKHKKPHTESTRGTAAKSDPLKNSKMLRNTQVVEFDNYAFDERETKKSDDKLGKLDNEMDGSEALLESIEGNAKVNTNETMKNETNLDLGKFGWMNFPQNKSKTSTNSEWEPHNSRSHKRNELDGQNILQETSSNTTGNKDDENKEETLKQDRMDVMGAEHNILHVVVKSDEVDYGDKEYFYEDFGQRKNGKWVSMIV